MTERILAVGAFGILDDLAHRRLPHIQIGTAFEVSRGDFLVGLSVHEWISCIRPSAILARI